MHVTYRLLSFTLKLLSVLSTSSHSTCLIYSNLHQACSLSNLFVPSLPMTINHSNATKLCLHYCYPLSAQLKFSFYPSSPMLHLYCPFTLKVFLLTASSLLHYALFHPFSTNSLKAPLSPCKAFLQFFPCVFHSCWVGGLQQGSIMPEQTHQIPSPGPTLMHSFPAKACFLAPSPSVPRILCHSLFSLSLSLSLGFTVQLGMASTYERTSIIVWD